MKVTVDTSKIDLSPAMRLIDSDKFWLFASHEWQRLLYDYIPHDTNQLRRNVEYRPNEIIYKSPYARYIYYGMKMADPLYGVGGFPINGGEKWFSRPGIKKELTDTPLIMKNGTRLWDKKAIADKKDVLLLQSLQNWINKNL